MEDKREYFKQECIRQVKENEGKVMGSLAQEMLAYIHELHRITNEIKP